MFMYRIVFLMYLLFVCCQCPAAVGTTCCASGKSKDRCLTGFASNCVSTLCGNSCERSCLLILNSILEHVVFFPLEFIKKIKESLLALFKHIFCLSAMKVKLIIIVCAGNFV